MSLNTLKTLHTEHQCLLGQACQIEEQLDRVRNGYDPDYVLLNDRVHFLKEHYTGVHHPKDRALVQRLLDGSGDLGVIMAPFLNLHAAAFLRNLDKLETDLRAVLNEQIVSRDDLMRHGVTALLHLREQIATEETGPFPWARERLQAKDWENVDQAGAAVLVGRRRVDCSKADILFPGLARRLLPEAIPMKDSHDASESPWCSHRGQERAH